MSEDSAPREGGSGASASPGGPRTKATAPASEQPRQRGRPRIGRAHSIRLSASEEAIAASLSVSGDAEVPFAEGVRLALRHIELLGRPLQLDEMAIEMLRSIAPRKDLATCIEKALQQNLPPNPNEVARAVMEQHLGKDLLAFAQKLGRGDAFKGLSRALRVAEFMGPDTVSKIAPEHGNR